MKISHRSIPKFQGGGTTFNLDDWINQNKNYYDWYSKIYPNAQRLAGNPLQQRNDNWDKEQLSSSHYTTDDLRRSAYNNYLYTGDYNARQSDLQHWANSLQDLNNISDQDLVSRYNTIAGRIRAAREAPQTYNTRGYTGTNRDFRSIFESRSKQGTNNPLYVIGYQDNLEDIEGTSTWQRRMDRYQTKFEDDTEEGKKNRVFYIKRPNGTTVKVYKKENGDIALFEDPQTPPTENPTSVVERSNPGPLAQEPKVQDKINPINSVRIGDEDSPGKFFDWGKIGEGIKNILGNPDLYAAGRLAGNLINNARVYDEALKGIKPVLKDTYLTHRQVVGDEATKQAYYRRAAQGQTKAARPFTSDADRQMAYQMEAKRVGDELRAQGDLADNQEIRRTSDESNQHQWANTQRATEVANYNTASINQANALKHNLLAQKHSAQWSSIDNFLKGIEYRKRQQLAEKQQMDDRIWELQMQDQMATDPDFVKAKSNYDLAYKKLSSEGATEEDEENYTKAEEELARVRKQLLIKYYQNLQDRMASRHLINWSKYGSKITWKRKEDLLYKSARDVVDHFRKISKIASDSYNRKQPKIEKLTSHPKGITRRYQQGGTAPFTVYTPVTLGGETSSTYSYDSGSGSGSSSKKSEGQDLLKDLLKTLSFEGLPSDVNSIYTSLTRLLSRSQAYGTELSFDDVASLYVRQMQKINAIKYNKSQFDKAQSTVNNRNAQSELALDSYGRLVAQNKEGGIEYISVDDYKENSDKYIPLTNDQVLNFRALGKAFDSNLIQVASNATSMEEIGKFLKAQLPKIGNVETTIEGYTKQDSNLIRQGVALLKDAPAGDYKFTEYIKNLPADQRKQAQMAVQYLQSILPRNMQNLISVNSQLFGGLSKSDLIYGLVHSGTDENYKMELTAVTGKASDSSKKSGTDGDIKSNFLDQLQRDQIGIDREFSMVTKDGPSKLYSLNSKYISQLPNVAEDMNLNEMLDKSKIGSIMDSRLGVTFGDQVINPNDFKDIMFDLGGGATVVTLPCKYENGHKVVNFAIKDEFDNAIKEVSKNIPIDYSNPTFVKALSEKLHEKGLDSLLSGDSIDPNMLGHFLVVSAYTTDKINVNTNSRYIEKVKNPDKSLEERLIKGLSTNKDKNDYELDIDDKWGLFELTYDDVYRGSVFIPLNNDPVSAQTGWGNDNIKLDETRNLAEQYQNYQKSLKQKDSSSRNLYERE